MSYELGNGDLQRHVSSLPDTATATPVQAREANPAAEQSVRTIAAADHTDLSSLGGLVSRALESSDTRTARVASLQQAIASGQYKVSSSDIAEKLIQSLLE